MPRVSLAEDEPLRSTLEPLLRRLAEPVVDCPSQCTLRLVGPAEIEAGGPKILRQHRLRSPGVPALVLVPASAPWTLVRDCFREGAEDVVSVEEIDSSLERVLRRALERAASGRGREAEAQGMATELGKRARDLESALVAVSTGYDQTLAALVRALDCREHETASHSQRVAVYSVLVGFRVGLDASQLETLYRGALLHDIGKIGIPDAVLLKPGSFSPEEWAIMRQHTEIGGNILSGISFLKDASAVPLCHHEAWDGGGYPAGLSGLEIPLDARIFAVVDSYDAIRSERPYKPAQGHEEAIGLLQRAANRRLDPTVVELFAAESASTWVQLDESLTEDLTFQGAMEVCRRAMGS